MFIQQGVRVRISVILVVRVAKEYSYYYDDAKIDLCHELPLLLHCFQLVQPRAKSGYESPYVNIVRDTDSIAEYESEEGERDIPSKFLPCQLPPKELNQGSFTLPYTIGSLNLYDMANLGANVNVMPKSMFKHLKLANLKEIDILVEMADMTKKAPLGIVENIMVRYGNKTIDDTTRERRYYEWVAQNSEFNDNGVSHEAKMYENPYKYHHEKGKKGYALDDAWEKYEKFHGGTLYPWHDEGFKEEERWESGIEKTNYELPFVDIETFEIKRYSFEGGRSFVCITKQLDDPLPLGRANGSRFMGMISKEMDEEGGVQRKM
ncbi:hypothetical protein Tco_0668169 [Tanacetum coccineum]